MKKTIFSHFYNEEILLPIWLKHHLALFDHGVLIDHRSTDESAVIIRAIAPNWELRRSSLENFDAEFTDHEIMGAEQEFDGWKIALNTTELLLMNDIDRSLAKHEADGVSCIALESAVMVDRIEDVLNLLDPNMKITDQCRHGFIDRGYSIRSPRYLHRHPHGAYSIGRHTTRHECVGDPHLVCWLAFVAFDQLLPRKLAIQTRVPESDFHRGRGIHHLVDEQTLRDRHRQWAGMSQNLMHDPQFRAAVEGI